MPQRVYEPGSPVGEVKPAISHQWGFPPSCLVCAGTTGDIWLTWLNPLSNPESFAVTCFWAMDFQ